MKTIKVAEATNTQLDWLVAKCEGRVETGVYGTPEVVEGALHIYYCDVLLSTPYAPTTDWSLMGPIIERERVMVSFGPQWYAVHHARLGKPSYGPTPLIAAARCYVASKLGDEVEVPEELT